MSLLLCALGAFGILIVLLIRPLLSPLRSVPGPFLARWTDAWYLWKVWRGDFEKTNKRLHELYGPIVRYGPSRYSIDHPDALDLIYSHGTQYTKSTWYTGWTAPLPWGGEKPNPASVALFADQSIARHSSNRRQFQSTYTMTSLVSYEPYVDDCADIFAQRLEELAAAGLAVDMRHWFQCYAFDVIGMITYGQRFGFLDRGEDVKGIMAALDDHLGYATCVGIYPFLHPILYRLKNLLAGEKGAGRAFLIKYTHELISQHRSQAKGFGENDVDFDLDDEEHGKTESFLSKFHTKHVKNPANFAPQHAVSGCVSNIVAGSDTTAISLSAILYHLLTNTQCLQKLREEIYACENKRELSANPTFKESQQMPYLQAVIKEALRLHPATGLPLERVVPTEGLDFEGRRFPSGTTVGINTWVEHRNTSIFGTDADHFRPERWLADDADHLRNMNRHFIAFGIGSRTCIGRNISMLEMSKLVPRIIRDFDFHIAEDFNSEKAWVTSNSWFVKPINFKLRVTRRKNSNGGP